MANGPDRASTQGTIPEQPNLTASEIALIEARNGLRQYDRMREMIDEAVAPGARFRLRPSTLMELNRVAVEGLMVGPGSYRVVPITITHSQHVPPPAEEVPNHVDAMCEYVGDNWAQSPIHLAAYILWRLNWIHPFRDGNGRTSRAVSYLVLCARLGYRLPGVQTIPERIAASKGEYYRALDAADAAWIQQRIDVIQMEEMLSAHLAAQLIEIHHLATGQQNQP